VNAANLALVLVTGGLFAAGAYLMLSWSLVRVVMGVVLLGHAANLVLLQAGGPAGDPPVSGRTEPAAAADPLPQAMALTAIVITFGVAALLLALVHRHHELQGDDTAPDEPEEEP
jgi:multicomponent Na+:H+ antiporter subunit C